MNYFYTFIKANEFITLSGSGEDPTDIKDLEWTASEGAQGVLKQMESIGGMYSPIIGFVNANDYKDDMYVQIAKFDTIYKNGWRFENSNIPAALDVVKSEVLEKSKTKRQVYVKASRSRRAYWRMQEVGREEIDPKGIDNRPKRRCIWR
jgi:ATP sulfurylase